MKNIDGRSHQEHPVSVELPGFLAGGWVKQFSKHGMFLVLTLSVFQSLHLAH
jgi:hypothetical protein